MAAGTVSSRSHPMVATSNSTPTIRRVASRCLAGEAVGFWLCKGYRPRDAEEAWHITSVDIDPASFPKMNSIFA